MFAYTYNQVTEKWTQAGSSVFTILTLLSLFLYKRFVLHEMYKTANVVFFQANVFCWNISLSTNLLFMKNDYSYLFVAYSS